MVLFTSLLITLMITVVVATIIALVGGVGFVVLFSDIIVCVAIIVWIIKRLTKKKKSK